MSGLPIMPRVALLSAVILSPREGVLRKATLLPACTLGAHIYQSAYGTGIQGEEMKVSRKQSIPTCRAASLAHILGLSSLSLGSLHRPQHSISKQLPRVAPLISGLSRVISQHLSPFPAFTILRLSNRPNLAS